MITTHKHYNITDFGAVADGENNNAGAIQEAIDTCSDQGGGRVIIPAGGVFMAGRIVLRSRVELHLEHGAMLRCSPHIDEVQLERGPYQHGPRCAFISAEDTEDIAITGLGTIDGNGRAYIKERLPHIYVMPEKRPVTFCLAGSRRVTITDITIRDGANWTLWVVGCDDVTIDRIRLYNDLKLPNSDGIDIDRCRNVHITNCHIECGDDAIVLKTMRGFERYGATNNVIVRGCTLKSTSSAICIGCEIAAPVTNVIFDSCIITSSHRGLSINHSFEANIENVLFSNMFIETRLFHDRWWGRGEPIYVKNGPWTEKDSVGRIRNVRFQNIRARGENGILVFGHAPDYIEGLEFDNVSIEMEKWTKHPGGEFDLRPCPGAHDGYGSGVKKHPIYAFYLRNATGLVLRNCSVKWKGLAPEYYRDSVHLEQLPGLVMENFKAEMRRKKRNENPESRRISPHKAESQTLTWSRRHKCGLGKSNS